MHRVHAWIAPLLAGLLLLPRPSLAEPEVWLVVGPIPSPAGPHDLGPSAEAFTREAGAVPLHERDVVAMPTCDAPLTFGFRPSPDASTRELMAVRLLKRRTASGCALDVLTIGTARRRGKTPTTHGSTNLPPSNDGLRRENARDFPCGTQLIVIREGQLGGRSGTMPGLGPSGDCTERTDDMLSPLGIRWLVPPAPPRGAR